MEALTHVGGLSIKNPNSSLLYLFFDVLKTRGGHPVSVSFGPWWMLLLQPWKVPYVNVKNCALHLAGLDGGLLVYYQLHKFWDGHSLCYTCAGFPMDLCHTRYQPKNVADRLRNRALTVDTFVATQFSWATSNSRRQKRLKFEYVFGCFGFGCLRIAHL